MLRSPRMIRLIHAVFFAAFNALLAVFLYEVITWRITSASFIALGIFLIEVIILVVNRWRCPLTVYAETLGSASGRVTDIFLPKWIADRAFQVYGVLFAAGIALLVIRLLS